MTRQFTQFTQFTLKGAYFSIGAVAWKGISLSSKGWHTNSSPSLSFYPQKKKTRKHQCPKVNMKTKFTWNLRYTRARICTQSRKSNLDERSDRISIGSTWRSVKSRHIYFVVCLSIGLIDSFSLVPVAIILKII